MEAEITLDRVEWKEGGAGDQRWRQLRLIDKGGNVYSCFEREIKDAQAKELVAKLKAGDALKIVYEPVLWRGREVRNLKGFLDYEPASTTPQADEERMTKAEWEAKDRKRNRGTCLIAASNFYQGRAEVNGTIAKDVISAAQAFFDWIYEEEK